jgi:hypothetical protein
VAIVAAGTAAGTVLTILAGSEPGLLLGLFLVTATIVGTFVVATRAAYVVIPAPAIAYPVAAVLAGYAHDHAVATSLTGLAVSAVQWIASGFIAMTAATVLAIAITAGRWMFTGPGGRRAYRDSPLRGGRWGRYRSAHGPAQGAGEQAEPEAGGMPAGSRRSG